MTRCLSTQALLRLYAGAGGEKQRLHVDACDVCSRRFQRMSRELQMVNRVLQDTDEPVRAVAARTRLWVPASAMATALVAVVVLLSSSAVRAPLRRSQLPMPADEAAALLEDISLAMFSIDGRPAAPLQEARLLGAPVGDDLGCDVSYPLASPDCDEPGQSDRLLNLFELQEGDL